MGKFLKKLNEFDNSRKLNKMYPSKVYDKIVEIFSKSTTEPALRTFYHYYLHKNSAFYPGLLDKYYKDASARLQIVYQYQLFLKMWYTFVLFLKPSNVNPEWQTEAKNYYNVCWDLFNPIITEQEYKNIPKRYRSALIKTKKGEEGYKLHITGNEPQLAISVDKNNSKKLYNLLFESKNLLDHLCDGYTNPNSSDSLCNFIKSDIKDDLFVSDKQIESVTRIHDIFIEIAKMTKIYDVPKTNKSLSGAITIFNEYTNVLTHKNKYLDAYNKFRKLKSEKIKNLHDAIMCELKYKSNKR